MMKVWTHAGLRRRLKRLVRPVIAPLKFDRLGNEARSGDDDGDRGGEGRREPERDFRVMDFLRPSPISSAYGETDERRRLSCRIWCSFSSSSISTSCISAATPSSGLIARPSFNMRPPKTRNSAAAA